MRAGHTQLTSDCVFETVAAALFQSVDLLKLLYLAVWTQWCKTEGVDLTQKQ